MIGPDEELPSFITADEEEETGADGSEQGGGVVHMWLERKSGGINWVGKEFNRL